MEANCTVSQGPDQMCVTNLTAQGYYFWLEHFQTHPAYLHNFISSN